MLRGLRPCGGLGKAKVRRPNVTIVSRYEKGLRGMLVEASETVYLVESLSERMGYGISRLVMGASASTPLTTPGGSYTD